MTHSDDLDELDRVVKNLSREGNLKSITVNTPSGYVVEISEVKYQEAAKDNRNPITQIINVTSKATSIAESSSSVSQEIKNIIRQLEDSNLSPRKLSEAKKNLNQLENELDKPSPDEKVIRRIMRWASNFNLELALRIAVLVSELLSV